MTSGSGCPLPIAPVCDIVKGAGSGLASDVLSAIVGWIVQGASWLLDQLGYVMSSTTTVDLGASWFTSHYAVMGALAGVVAVPMLLLSAIQAIYRQSAAVLARAAFVHLPLAGLLTAVAVQLVQLSLTVTDALCATVSQSGNEGLAHALADVATVLLTTAAGGPMPGFVVGLGALLVVVGALVLWLELIVRSAAVYVAVLFMPLAMASLVWPAVSHWCRRLVETLAAIVLSKFVVVAVLSLAVGAIGTGKGFATVLTGGALLLLAAFTPFTLLRLVPMIESGAALQLEGARQRVRQTFGSMPQSAASFALRRARMAGLSMGEPGTGTVIDPGAPGDPGSGGGPDVGPGGGRSGGPSGLGGVAGFAGSGVPGGAGGTRGTGGTMEEETETRRNGLLPLGPLPPEAVPGTRRLPPGTLPLWKGTPEGTAALLAAIRIGPTKVVPDGAGGIVPGVTMPLWGDNLPPSRFEPGPRDDWWTSEELIRELENAPLHIRWPTQERWSPPEPPYETLDGDVW